MNLDGSYKQRQREAEMQRRVEGLERWQESEWVLECLRARTGTPMKAMSDDEIVDWHRKIQR